ncbi:MAG: hypothetical protein KJP18_11035 [Gemmatimonadetes bacterium]|nr:hypothetical protein [Gemmatimonadota bacterium]
MTTPRIANALQMIVALLVPGGGVAGADLQNGNRAGPPERGDSVPVPALPGTPTVGGIQLRAPAIGEMPDVALLVDSAAAALDRCTSSPPPDGPYGTVRAALADPDDDALRIRLGAIHDSLEAAGELRSHDVETLYLSAVVMGARSEMASGRDKLRWGEAMYTRSRSVLDRDPDHAATRHLVGRVHAAVRRMSGFKRFVARSLFGGDLLGAASWESARVNLEAAEAGAPCIVDHHYELARLYADLGEPDLALREIRHVVRLTRSDADDEPVLRKARSLLAELERDAN